MPKTPPENSVRANYQSIFDSALQEYTKKTRKDLSSEPLFHNLQSCDSPDDIMTILQQQIPEFGQSAGGNSDDRLTRWLDPTVKVINAFSATIGGAVALVGPSAYGGNSSGIYTLITILQAYPLGGVIFAGIGILLSVSGYLFHFLWLSS